MILGGKNRKEMTTCLGNGVVAGFMLWSDIMGMYNTDGQVYSFCQSVDPFIEDGWMVYRDA